MHYFIQSAGYARHHGFRYYEINTDTGQLTHISRTKIEQEDNPAFKGLVDADEFYLALLNYQNKYSLFVGGLYSDDRYDFDSRKLGNYLVFYAENEDENDQLQQLAASILGSQENFRKAVDGVIRPNSAKDGTGFSLNWREYQDLLSGYWQSNKNDRNTLAGQKIAKPSLNRKTELAQELKDYSLPKKDGVLVVVTENTKVTMFEKEKLSSSCRILTASSEANEWKGIDIDLTGEHITPTETARNSANTKKKVNTNSDEHYYALVLYSSPQPPVSNKDTISFFWSNKNFVVDELRKGRFVSTGNSCNETSTVMNKPEIWCWSDLSWHDYVS